MDTQEIINKLQRLADERNWIIAQRDKMIARYELKPHEPMYNWWVTYSFNHIVEIDSLIAKAHKELHREQLSVVEALGL